MAKYQKIIFIIFLIIQLCEVALSGQDSVKVTKFDLDGDGISNLVIFEHVKDSIAMEIIGGVVSRIEFHHETKEVVAQALYEKQGNNFVIKYGFATSEKIFNSEKSCSAGLSSRDNFPLQMREINDKSSIESLNFDQSCINNPKLKAAIDRQLSQFMRPDIQMPFAKCLGSTSIAAGARWRNLSKSVSKFKYVCPLKPFPSGSYEANDRNQIAISSQCLDNSSQLSKVLAHELIHGVGSFDHAIVECVVTECPSIEKLQGCVKKNGGMPSKPPGDNSGVIGLLPVNNDLGPGTPTEVSEIYNKNKVQPVALEVPDDEINSHVSNVFKVRNGPQEEVEGSFRSPLGNPFALLSKVFPNQEAVASLGRQSPGVDVKSPRSPAGSLTSQNEEVNNRSSSKKVVRDSTIADEKDRKFEAKSTFNSAQNIGSKMSGKSAVKSAEIGVPAENQQRISSEPRSTFDNSTSRLGRAPAALGSVQENSRDKAYRGKGSKGSKDKKEIVEYLTDGKNYQSIKSQFRNPEFQKELRENGIAIIRPNGTKLGAQNPLVTFGDTGKEIIDYTPK